MQVNKIYFESKNKWYDIFNWILLNFTYFFYYLYLVYIDSKTTGSPIVD